MSLFMTTSRVIKRSRNTLSWVDNKYVLVSVVIEAQKTTIWMLLDIVIISVIIYVEWLEMWRMIAEDDIGLIQDAENDISNMRKRH